MKSFYFDLLFSFAMASLITTMMFSIFIKENDSVSLSIDNYLTSVDFQASNEGEVAVFSDFLVKENGDFISVDFMVEEDGQVTILNKEFNEEYYLFDTYSSQLLKQYTSQVALTIPIKAIRT